MTELPIYDPDRIEYGKPDADEPPDSFVFDVRIRGRMYRVARITAVMLGEEPGRDPGCGCEKFRCLGESADVRCGELPACREAFYPEVTDETLGPIMALRMGVRDEPA